MKVKSAARFFVSAACLLALNGLAEDMSLLRDETGAMSHMRRNTETGDLYAPGPISQTAPADAGIAFDQLPPTAAGPMRPDMSQEEPLDGCD